MTGCKRWVTVGLILLLAGCTDSIDDVMERAVSLQEAGQYRAAIAEYRDVLQQDAEHAEARFRLGQVAALVGDYDGAEVALRRAANLGIPPDRVQPLLAAALMGQQDYTSVLERIEPESVSEYSLQAELLAARATAYLRLERVEQARAAVDTALGIHERSVPAYVAAARLALAEGNVAKASDHVDEALFLGRRSAAALLTAAQVARQSAATDRAIELLAEALEAPPTDLSASAQEMFNARGTYIELLLGLRRSAEARENLDIMLRQGPRHPYPNYLAAVMSVSEDDLDAAIEHLQITLSASPDSVSAKALMGVIRSRQGQHQRAITLLQEVIAAQPENLRSRLILASALRESGEERQAARVLADGVRHASNDPGALAALTAAAGDDIEAVIESLEHGSPASFDVRHARLGLAQALVDAGNVDPAISMLQQMEPEEGDEFLRRQFLALAALRGGDTETALSTAEELVADYPGNANAHNLLGGIYLTVERFEDARMSFEESRRLNPEGAHALFNLGLLAAATGDSASAVEYLERGLELSPDNRSAVLRLADIHRQSGDIEAAMTLTGRAIEIDPDNAEARIALARLQVAHGEPEAALDAANRAVEIAPASSLAHGLKGMARLNSDNAEGAIESFTTALELTPEEPDLRYQLARAQSAAGDDTASRRTLEELIESHPGRLDAHGALIHLQLRHEDHADAIESARRMQRQSGGEAEGALLEGHAHSNAGDRAAAIEAYERAVEYGRAEALGPLVANRAEAGYTDPAAPLESWISDNPDNVPARFSLANWYLERGDHDDAARHYERLSEVTEHQNAVVLNNLAWLYQQIGDDRALSTARRAHDLAPESAAVIDTLGWIHYQSGNIDEAVDFLSDAAERAPEDPQILYHYGAALAEAGDHVAAREVLNRALEISGDAEWSSDARAILDSL